MLGVEVYLGTHFGFEVSLLLKKGQQRIGVFLDVSSIERGLRRIIRDLHQAGVVEPLGPGKLEDAEPDRGLYDQQHPDPVPLGFDLQLHLIEVPRFFQGLNAFVDLFFREWFSRVLGQERQQFARIKTRTTGDLDRSHVLALIGRQDGLGLGSGLGLIRGLLCRLSGKPTTEDQYGGQPQSFFGCPAPGLSRHSEMSHEQLIPRHLPVRCRKEKMRLMRKVVLALS